MIEVVRQITNFCLYNTANKREKALGFLLALENEGHSSKGAKDRWFQMAMDHLYNVGSTNKNLVCFYCHTMIQLFFFCSATFKRNAPGQNRRQHITDTIYIYTIVDGNFFHSHSARQPIILWCEYAEINISKVCVSGRPYKCAQYHTGLAASANNL